MPSSTARTDIDPRVLAARRFVSDLWVGHTRGRGSGDEPAGWLETEQ